MKTVTRAFRIPKSLDETLTRKAKSLGFVTPSEYLRYLVRTEVTKNSEEIRQ